MHGSTHAWPIIAKQTQKKFTSSVMESPPAPPTRLSFPSLIPRACLQWPSHPTPWGWILNTLIAPFLGLYLIETQPIPLQTLMPQHGNTRQPLPVNRPVFITGPDGKPNANLLERAFAFQFFRNLLRRCNLFSGNICAARWHARRRLKI